jgi:hypothetical protein
MVNDQHHEITIYAITSVHPIDWSSPSKLLKTIQACYFKASLKKNFYVIGHVIAQINSPLLSKPVFAAMLGAVKSEKVVMVIKKKIGLGAMGYTFQGKMEPEERIKKGIALYSKRKKIAFLKIRINEESLYRLLRFIDYYQNKTEDGLAPCNYYNGALWPAFGNEGAGCSSFGMSLLDIANIFPKAANEWCLNLKIPMDLIGGELNNNKVVKIGAIRRAKKWHSGEGIPDIDYVNHRIYDPNLIFKWIMNKRNENDPEFQDITLQDIPGLVTDMTAARFDEEENFLKKRQEFDLFVANHYNKICCAMIE